MASDEGGDLTGGTAAVGGVAAAAADLEPLRVGTLLRTWQPGTAERLGEAFFCASLAEKGARISWKTVLLLAAHTHKGFWIFEVIRQNCPKAETTHQIVNGCHIPSHYDLLSTGQL